MTNLSPHRPQIVPSASVAFEATPIGAVATLQSYAGSLSSPIDSFLEAHIALSAFHRIVIDNADVGHVAVHGDGLLTQFHLVGGMRRYGAQILAEVKRSFAVTNAIVPTCDEFFLSHALDDYAELKKQACFFVDADPTASLTSAHSKATYREAMLVDIAAIEGMCGDFIERFADRVANHELYVGHLEDELVALGILERSTLFPGQASIGMFTRESLRGSGIGTCTIRYMRSVCHIEGLRAIAGCAYHNVLSRRTLEAAGMTTVTRLLRFEFGGDV